MASHSNLSRRERQIIDILYRRQRATAQEVMQDLAEPPSYSAVRAALRVLEEKGHIRHEKEGAKYVFVPTVDRDKAKRSAIRHLIRTFFDGSPQQAVLTLLDVSGSRLSPADLDRLAESIRKARRGNKP
jgi:predicted transcriptional regulator